MRRRVPLVEQELPSRPEHLCSHPGFNDVRVTRSLVCKSLFVLLYYVFWPLCCLFFCLLAIVLYVLLSFGHCVVCPSVFWPLCCLSFCLLAIVLSVLLSFGHCGVCPSVIWPLWCLSFCLLAIVLSVLLRFTDYDYPFSIFKLFLVTS